MVQQLFSQRNFADIWCEKNASAPLKTWRPYPRCRRLQCPWPLERNPSVQRVDFPDNPVAATSEELPRRRSTKQSTAQPPDLSKKNVPGLKSPAFSAQGSLTHSDWGRFFFPPPSGPMYIYHLYHISIPTVPIYMLITHHIDVSERFM